MGDSDWKILMEGPTTTAQACLWVLKKIYRISLARTARMNASVWLFHSTNTGKPCCRTISGWNGSAGPFLCLQGEVSLSAGGSLKPNSAGI